MTVSAGLSERCPFATATASTAPMRWRSRFAVVDFVCQIGESTRNTSSVVMSSTARSPISGKANSSSVPIHCAACFVLRHPDVRCSKSA